jgi:hypothetical protein
MEGKQLKTTEEQTSQTSDTLNKVKTIRHDHVTAILVINTFIYEQYSSFHARPLPPIWKINLISSTKLNPFWEANIHSASQDIPNIL